MLVGNVATLRPLFHRVLRLGANGSEQANTRGETPGLASSKRQSHTYRPFYMDLELGTTTDNIFESQLSNQIHGGRTSLGSDSESQKQSRDKSGIIVSHQVEVSRE